MSVTTGTDEAIDELKQSIYKAVQSCNKILDSTTLGYDECSPNFLFRISTIRDSLQWLDIELNNPSQTSS